METPSSPETLIFERREAVRLVVERALERVREKYGTGNNDGENPKYYHNYGHSLNALESAKSIAALAVKNGIITEREVELLEIAAAGHDLEQGFSSGVNEQRSAEEVAIEMAGTNKFTQDDIKRVTDAILATTPIFENGTMKQSVTEDYLTLLIADADLASLGQAPEEYWRISQGLLKEIKNSATPTLDDQLAWAKGQIAFLSNHQFHTPEANAIFSNKEANIAYAKEQVASLEAEINR